MKISVPIVTYNQERYVAQAIESALMQLGGFEIEIIVGDDCSSDRTREVVSDFAARFPGKVRSIFQPSNTGGSRNFKSVYDASDGDYIALLEGDDLWTDPLKLAKQVAFLETRRDYSLCFHNTVVFHEDGSNKAHPFNTGPMKETYTLRDILVRNFIQTCSVMYRGGILRRIPEWFLDMPMGDWPLHILHAEHGFIGYLSDIMSLYRVHAKSVWTSLALVERTRRSIAAAGTMDAAFNFRHHAAMNDTTVVWYNDLIDAYLGERRVEEAAAAAFEALEAVPDEACHAPYKARYVNIFMTAIASLAEQGRQADALALYERHIGKLPNVGGLDRLGEVMRRLKTALAVSRLSEKGGAPAVGFGATMPAPPASCPATLPSSHRPEPIPESFS